MPKNLSESPLSFLNKFLPAGFMLPSASHTDPSVGGQRGKKVLEGVVFK